ncbi:C4-dicarboxylate ABC transporter substrate-binding protein [Virgisporangium aliadipatigenens]|uniref:C4-dicarboxylate ABC transporter substrate-binding protein n=1 Tax=Virgisporangium aliadipatigenens TaxID=741659 RepID=A0A8J3YR79_9ACTN|nr:tripartite tricarboxylate transporter substrate-binding protein [Virgisporangium aliadipatigenens]GIJ48293.1 C4-dicarboxylate ABC transporter substrate-binding protein [Virgisporangium aliadipatigenens]
MNVKGVAPFVAAAVATAVLLVSTVASSGDEGKSDARAFLDGRQLRIMAPAAPGGGWDQTAREMQSALRGTVGRTEVYNVNGAGGTIGLSQYTRYRGQPTELMVMGLVMVGAIASNHSPVTLSQTTPLARLTTDYEIIVVPTNSPVQSMRDLVARMRADLGSVSIAGGSAGGVEQILAGLVGRAIGGDPAKVNYIAHSGGGEALTTVLSGSATAAVSGVSELVPQVKAGKMRALAVSSPQRLPALPDVPTLKEAGVDVELANWRAVVAPAGITVDEESALEDVVVEMTRGDAWQETLRRRGWADATMVGPEFDAFMESEQRRIAQVLKEMGLA